MSKSEDSLAALIGAIYEAAADPAAWERVCRRLADAFGATGFAVQINDVAAREIPLYVTSGIDPAAAAEYTAEIAKNDPRVLFSLAQPLGLPHHDYCFINEREMSRHPYYAFLGKWGFRYYAGGAILRNGSLIGNASFQRSPEQGPATEADLDLLRRLLPHLGRAVELGLRVETLELRRAAVEHMLEQASYGAALLDEAGNVLFMNREARRIVASGAGLVAGTGGLRALRAAEDAALQRLICGAVAVARRRAIAGGGTLSIRKRGSLHFYAITVSAVPRMDSFFATRDPAVIVMISDPDAGFGLSRELLHDAYGLSPAEVEVVKALADGRTIAQIATERRVSVRTVRAQLGSIFRKTDTARQTDLLRLLRGLPNGCSP